MRKREWLAWPPQNTPWFSRHPTATPSLLFLGGFSTCFHNHCVLLLTRAWRTERSHSSKCRHWAPCPSKVSSEFLLLGAGKEGSLLNSFHFQLPFSMCSGVKIRKVLRQGSGKMKRLGMFHVGNQKGSSGHVTLSPFLLTAAKSSAKSQSPTSCRIKRWQSQEKEDNPQGNGGEKEYL